MASHATLTGILNRNSAAIEPGAVRRVVGGNYFSQSARVVLRAGRPLVLRYLDRGVSHVQSRYRRCGRFRHGTPNRRGGGGDFTDFGRGVTDRKSVQIRVVRGRVT